MNAAFDNAGCINAIAEISRRDYKRHEAPRALAIAVEMVTSVLPNSYPTEDVKPLIVATKVPLS
jgi:hypothetical protein